MCQLLARIDRLPLGFWGTCLWMGCLWLTGLSGKFAYGVPALQRPVLEVVGLLVVMSVVHLFALRGILRQPPSSSTGTTIVLFAVAMRLVMLFSTPIQELDYYRYIWDGESTLAGVSPYQYSPIQVLGASQDASTISDDFSKLIQLRDRQPVTATIISRVHFGELPTIYPPVSLAVFALAAATTPESATVETSIIIMKAWIVLFDLGIVWLLVRLLKHLGLHPGWLIAYAWCPLMIKEFANSGHLDAIAVAFMLGACVSFVMNVFPKANEAATLSINRRQYWSGCWLGLAIGAKLFPLILLPLFSWTLWKRQGWRPASLFLSVAVGTAALTCWPMLMPNASDESVAAPYIVDSDPQDTFILPTPPTQPGSETTEVTPHPPQKSLKVFLTQWKINDLFFMVIESNLAPTDGKVAAWSVVTPDTWRRQIVDRASHLTGWSPGQTPFLITRILLSGVFITLALWWSWKAAHSELAVDWLRYVFLTLAWFWVLSPTLNPWYWSWALPLIPFSKNRGWLLVGVLLPMYYLRFWFAYNWEGVFVLGTPYAGESFFHYVVVWFEHVPWLVWLVVESFGQTRRPETS